jgi:hypothetical protein
MTTEINSQEPSFGYLSIFCSAEHGYFGGYLLVSSVGRPLEFHCTAPVRPSRAQEILYGPTLHPYLVGEQIGGKLLSQAKLTPLLILADQAVPPRLSERIDVPIVQILFRDSPAACRTENDRLNLPDSIAADVVIPNCEFILPPNEKWNRSQVTHLLSLLAERVEVAEPFDRINKAIREAQRLSGCYEEHNARAA